VTLLHSLDFYKLTLGQLVWQRYSKSQVTFELKNRGKPLFNSQDQVERLKDEVESLIEDSATGSLTKDQIAFLMALKTSTGKPLFDAEYITWLGSEMVLPAVDIAFDRGELKVSTTGDWPAVSLWETILMAKINEVSYSKIVHKYDVALSRLQPKIKKLQSKPDIKIAEFGTRRRFNESWQHFVVGELIYKCPDNFIGTSNVGLACEYGVKPIGTFPHEPIMVYMAMHEALGFSPLTGQAQFLEDWWGFYGVDLSIALTDTVGSEYFFHKFTEEQAHNWKGFRHDSGDPYAYGKRVLNYYKELGIDSKTKTLVFSDGLKIDTIEGLHRYFNRAINLVFGWGTDLTCDYGELANNFVVKATAVNGIPTVKLSDVPGKNTGPAEKVAQYKRLATR
jgi:nicotinate phosphoribosyltransferase